ncbi:MAG: tetratricopeptide repeat protein [Mariprofundus sp.]|nr:tetratricopeptide repeat protein [Mariprofundus sp.]
MMHRRTLSYDIFTLLMWLSGLAGISYEILYGRILGNMVGDQFVVSAAILMTFLLGIGIGSALSHRLWRWLWAIEGGIGAYGLLIALNQVRVEHIVYTGSLLFTDSLLGSVSVCVLLLIVPAFLIGCSVPLFAGYFSRLHGKSNSSFARVYTVYNFGAALTALLIEFYIIRKLGIQGAVITFAMVNLLVGIGLKYFFTRDGLLQQIQSKTESPQPSSLKTLLFKIPWHALSALILASVASAIFQLFMVKYSELVFGPFRESFALVLSLVLSGITLGAMLVKHFKPGFQTVMWMNLAGLIWLMLAAGGAIYVYAALYPLAGDSFWLVIMLKWLILVVLMLLPATTFGATIPALLSHQGEVSHESGTLLFVSSIANVAGFLLMVFLLHRYLDYGVQLLVVGAVSVSAIIIYQHFHLRSLITASVAIAMMGGIYLQQWDEDLLYLSYTNFKDADDLIEARQGVGAAERYKGYQDVFAINWMDGDPYFFINGYISIPLNNPSEKIVGALSTLFAPRLDDALVLGLGSGATASVAGLFFKQTDVVEINPVVRENLFRMSSWNFDIEHNSHVNIIVDDAIHFVKSDEKQYSLILNTVTTPLYFSSSKLYTRDFFNDVKARLSNDGVYVTWMDSRIGDAGSDIILRSLQKSFRYCALLYVKSAYFLLIASDKPLNMNQQKAVITQPDLRKNLMQEYHVMSTWLPYQLLTTDLFSLIKNRDGLLNTANYPALEFEMARLQESGIPEFKKRLLAHLDIHRIEQAMPIKTEAFPADFIVHARKRLGSSSITRRWHTLLKDDLVKTESAGAKSDLAELAFRKVKMEVTQTADNIHAYGYQLIKLGRYAKAITVFYDVLKRDPEHANTYYNLGVCFEKLEQFDKALESFRQELIIDPEDQDASYRVARLLLQMQRYNQALEALNSYISNQGISRGKAYFYRAVAYNAIGKHGLAKADLMQAMRLGESEKRMADQLNLLENLRLAE